MSDQNPYGQPSDPYGQNPYGQTNYGGAVQSAGNYATFFQRVGAYLIDQIIMGLPLILAFVGIGMSASGTEIDPVTGELTGGGMSGAGLVLVLLGSLGALALLIWNICIKQGNTGCTIGEGMLGIKLISEETGQPIGPLMSFVRQLAHFVDGVICNIGYLFPLWDPKRQTIADKIMKTVVINAPKG